MFGNKFECFREGRVINKMCVHQDGKVTDKQLGSFIPLRNNKLKVQTQQIFGYKYPTAE
jgi:hypothetical protein